LVILASLRPASSLNQIRGSSGIPKPDSAKPDHALGGARLAAKGYPDRIASTEYDQWPRGRIVYETPTRRSVIYADRRLQQQDIIYALKTAFGLTESELIVRIRSDSHYR
jgi:hypothetical protein